jgi:hypothetical protein
MKQNEAKVLQNRICNWIELKKLTVEEKRNNEKDQKNKSKNN